MGSPFTKSAHPPPLHCRSRYTSSEFGERVSGGERITRANITTKEVSRGERQWNGKVRRKRYRGGGWKERVPISKDGVGCGPACEADSHSMGSEVEEGKNEARVRAGCGDLGREEKPKFCEVEARPKPFGKCPFYAKSTHA